MSFWKSKKHKAKKQHRCEYCGRYIQIGEEYDRETGTFEGDFQDYCLCFRCLFIIDKLENDEYLGDFYDMVFDNFLDCPACGKHNLIAYEFTDDRMSCECECDCCREKWIVDLSIDGIKEVMSRWGVK